ncbi:MAG: hypothetical protein GY821_05600 [Gammaproteobacteria bacterium]|nr:hypothetical protein [Gammaproteobacteria bacterium]
MMKTKKVVCSPSKEGQHTPLAIARRHTSSNKRRRNQLLEHQGARSKVHPDKVKLVTFNKKRLTKSSLSMEEEDPFQTIPLFNKHLCLKKKLEDKVDNERPRTTEELDLD